MTSGAKSKEIQYEGGPADLRAGWRLEAIWVAGSPVATAGIRGAHTIARDAVLRGAAAHG
jgi:hypothetical protein